MNTRKSDPSDGTASVLCAEGVSKSFHGKKAVDHVSLQVKQREIVGLLGRNGAGKTTTFRMIMGLIRPEGGKVLLNNKDISRRAMYERARMGIGYLAQEPSIFRGMTVAENIMAVLEFQRLTEAERRQRLQELLQRFGIEHLAKQKSVTLSGGEKRRLEIARSLATSPHFMLLDEPFSGVDPIAVGEIQELIQELRDMNIGILITDHSVRETLEVTDHSYIIHEGKVVKAGTPESIVKKLEATLKKALQDPEITGKMTKMGLTPRFLPGTEYEKICRDAVKSIPEMIEYNKALPEG